MVSNSSNVARSRSICVCVVKPLVRLSKPAGASVEANTRGAATARVANTRPSEILHLFVPFILHLLSANKDRPYESRKTPLWGFREVRSQIALSHGARLGTARSKKLGSTGEGCSLPWETSRSSKDWILIACHDGCDRCVLWIAPRRRADGPSGERDCNHIVTSGRTSGGSHGRLGKIRSRLESAHRYFSWKERTMLKPIPSRLDLLDLFPPALDPRVDRFFEWA